MKVKFDPDDDVVMKTDSQSKWQTSTTLYPPNGLNVKHEIKLEDIKQEKIEDTNKPDVKDDKKFELTKESEDKENEDGKKLIWHLCRF